MPNMANEDKSVLLEMLETGELCDFTFEGKDNVELHVHAHVFTMSSLSAKLAREMENSPNSKVILPVSSKTLRFFIEFAYAAKYHLTQCSPTKQLVQLELLTYI